MPLSGKNSRFLLPFPESTCRSRCFLIVSITWYIQIHLLAVRNRSCITSQAACVAENSGQRSLESGSLINQNTYSDNECQKQCIFNQVLTLFTAIYSTVVVINLNNIVFPPFQLSLAITARINSLVAAPRFQDVAGGRDSPLRKDTILHIISFRRGTLCKMPFISHFLPTNYHNFTNK